MILQLLFSNPILALAWIAAIIIALTVHEFAHAAVGKWRGDDTAEKFGRLTLNPMAHLDPMGFIMLLALGFGWAKPVPYNPANLRGSKYDEVLIALAGPASNILLAALGAGIFRALAGLSIMSGTALGPFLLFFVLVNILLMIFNLIPIHPLDGSKLLTAIFIGTPLYFIAEWLLKYGNQVLFVAVLFAIFTPIDPFFFIQAPSFGLCSQLMGTSCIGLFSVYFGG